MTKNISISWLVSLIEPSEDRHGVLLSELYAAAQLVNKATNKQQIGRLVKYIFPLIPEKRKRSATEEDLLYLQLKWKKPEMGTPISFSGLTAVLPENIILTEESAAGHYSLWCMTRVISNGSQVPLQITIRESIVNMKIRGRTVDMQTSGLTEIYDGSIESLKTFLYVCNQLEICRGVIYDPVKHKFDDKGLHKENTGLIGDENSEKTCFRSKKCEQLLNWTANKKVCQRCSKTIKKLIEKSKLKEDRCTPKNVLETPNNTEHLSDCVDLNIQDSTDLCSILSKVFPNAPEHLQILLAAQHKALATKNIKGMRWDRKIISVCLNLWIRSPRCYQDLKDSGLLILPSGRQLRKYKNNVPQRPGIHPEVLRWMKLAADSANIPQAGRVGALLYDEVKIQADLVTERVGKSVSLVGFVETNNEGFHIKCLKEGEVKRDLASDILQLTFLGNSGFRFPVCHFATNPASASDLFTVIWDTVSHLQDWGFIVDAFLQDGGQQNRDFMVMHFTGDPQKEHFLSVNLVNHQRKVAHAQDFSHVIKKIRNGILSSGTEKKHTRFLLHEKNPIVWQQWIDAVQWDRRTNSRLIHQKITEEHLFPSTSLKMRNKLAEDMLNDQMLYLMESYDKSLSSNNSLVGPIALLKHTAKLIKVFRDSRPIKDLSDKRLDDLKRTAEWFDNWAKSGITKKGEKPSVPSWKCLQDIQSMTHGFLAVCNSRTQAFPGWGVVPSRFNTDLIENHFCQQRGLHNGNNTNPTLASYNKTVNAIILGQSSVSRGRKSNSGIPSIEPYNFYMSAPATKKRKLSTL